MAASTTEYRDKNVKPDSHFYDADIDEKERLLPGVEDASIASPKSETNKWKSEKMGTFDTAVTLIAATVGGEIIAIPFAIYHMGLFLSISTVLAVASFSHISNMMHLKVKDLTPCNHESIYEIAYLLFGRPAIYLVCIVQYFLNFASIILYYMLIGDTGSQILAKFFVN